MSSMRSKSIEVVHRFPGSDQKGVSDWHRGIFFVSCSCVLRMGNLHVFHAHIEEGVLEQKV